MTSIRPLACRFWHMSDITRFCSVCAIQTSLGHKIVHTPGNVQHGLVTTTPGGGRLQPRQI
jgi:hypothetical protein